jgi:hypothetical protein
MMAQAGSRCGSWIVSTPETALRSAGTWSTSAAAEHRRVTSRPSELAGVEPRPARRRSPTAQLVSPSYDCVLCVAQHANGGVVGAHDHQPGRARGAGVGHAGAGLCERGRRVPRRGPGGRGARARPGGGGDRRARRPRRHGRSADPVSGSGSETPLLSSGGSGHPGRVTRDFRCERRGSAQPPHRPVAAPCTGRAWVVRPAVPRCLLRPPLSQSPGSRREQRPAGTAACASER